MIDTALTFLKTELNNHLKAHFGESDDAVELSSLVSEDGFSAIKKRLGIALINVEEERISRSQMRRVATPTVVTTYTEPELRLNLHIMIAAAATGSGTKYEEALKSLTAAVTYFQSHASFDPSRYPGLPEGIERLIVELETVDYEAQNNIWSALGGKFQPSVQYRIRLVAVQAGLVEDLSKPIQEIDSEAVG